MNRTKEKATTCTQIAEIEPVMVRTKQAAAICNVSTRQWHSMRAAGLCPPSIKINGCRFWSLEVIRKWVAMGCPSAEKFEKLLRERKTV